MCLPARSCGNAATSRTTDAPKFTNRSAMSSPFMPLILRSRPAVSTTFPLEIVQLTPFERICWYA